MLTSMARSKKDEYRYCHPRMLTSMARSTRTSIAIATGVVVAVLAIAVGLLVAQRRSGPSGDLSEAVKSGDADLVRAHLEAGADPDEPQVLGLTPLMRAAVRNDVAIVTLLLGAGARPECGCPRRPHCCSRGR
jgi:ankyrin repeat protein